MAAPSAPPAKKGGIPLPLLIAVPAGLLVVAVVGVLALTGTFSSGSGGTALYADGFESDKGKWMQPVGAGDRVYVEGGKLQVVSNAVDTVLTLPTTAAVSDLTAFTVEVDVTRLKGPDTGYAGIIIRWSNANDSYSAGYSGAGFYGLVRYSAATQKFTPLLDYKTSPAIKPAAGATNHLKVVVRGQEMTFFINGEQLGKVSDAAVSGGRIALFANPSMHVAFDNFKVTKP